MRTFRTGVIYMHLFPLYLPTLHRIPYTPPAYYLRGRSIAARRHAIFTFTKHRRRAQRSNTKGQGQKSAAETPITERCSRLPSKMGWRKKPRPTKSQDPLGLVKAQLRETGLKMSLEQDSASGQEVYTFDTIRGGMDRREVLHRINCAARTVRAGRHTETKGIVTAAVQAKNGKSDQEEGSAETTIEEPIENSIGSRNRREKINETENGSAQT